MTGWYLLIAGLLLLANGFFVGAEFALTAARRAKIERLAAQGSRQARAARASMEQLSFTLSGAQLGITMASLGLGYVAEPALARLFEAGLGRVVPANLSHTTALVIALTIVVFLHMVVGEMVPKNIAIARPEESALWVAGPFRVYGAVFRPIIWALNAMANGILRLLRVEPRDRLALAHSADDIAAMVATIRRAGVIEEHEHRLLWSALHLSERDAAEVMVPRPEMVVVSATSTPSEVERSVVSTGHSRFPVYGEGIDEVKGFLHAKDLLGVPAEGFQRPISPDLIRPMLVVPESGKLDRLLLEMRGKGNHMALVIDEHGGTAGLVTLEDIVEELVGEIQDEYDLREENGLREVGDGKFVSPGALRLDQLTEAVDLRLPEGEYDTLGGFIMEALGRIPRAGDRVEHEGWTLRVLRMKRFRVAEVEIQRGS